MIERIHIKDLSNKRFSDEFLDKKPVIIQGAMDSWECYKWDLNFLSEKYGERKVTIRQSDAAGVRNFKQTNLSEYIKFINDNKDLWYCDWNFLKFDGKDLKDTYSTPKYFKNNTIMSDGNGTEWKWFFLGSKDTGTPVHQDFKATHAWNGVMFGQKHWVFFHEDDTEYLYNGEVDVFNPDEYKNKPLLKKATPYTVIQHPGEVIYAPRKWWHQVVNTEHTFSVSENFYFKHELVNA